MVSNFCPEMHSKKENLSPSFGMFWVNASNPKSKTQSKSQNIKSSN